MNNRDAQDSSSSPVAEALEAEAARGETVGLTAGGDHSEMARRVRTFDWASTSIGAIATWPQSLRTAVQMTLASPIPGIVLWGPDLLQIYNDGYRDLMGDRHPAGLGQPTRDCWPEVWPINETIYRRVFEGESVSAEDTLYSIARSGVPEYTQFILPYTPIRGESGDVAGVLVTVFEATRRSETEETPRTNEKRMRGQKEAFQAAINGAPLADSLRILARIVIEETAGEARTAFYMADPDGTCLHPIRGAGDMPDAYADLVDGFLIEEDSLACGLATATTGRPVLTRDVFEEPRWKPWVHLAREYDYRGCWSFPIETHDGKPVGTLAMYFRTPREALPRDLALAAVVTQAAAIIIARHTEAEQRVRTEETLREDMEELIRFNRAAVQRELRMIELKKEVNELAGRQGEARRYPLEFEDGGGGDSDG